MKRSLILVVIVGMLFLGCSDVNKNINKIIPESSENLKEEDHIFINKMKLFSEERYLDGWFLVNNSKVTVYGYMVLDNDIVNHKVKVPCLYRNTYTQIPQEAINFTSWGFYRPEDIIQTVNLKRGIIYIGNNLVTYPVDEKYYYAEFPGGDVTKYPEIIVIDVDKNKFIIYIANFEEINKKYNITLEEKVQCDVSAFYFGYEELVNPYKFYNPEYYRLYLGDHPPLGFSGKTIKGFYYGLKLKHTEITSIRKFTATLHNETVMITCVEGYIR